MPTFFFYGMLFFYRFHSFVSLFVAFAFFIKFFHIAAGETVAFIATVYVSVPTAFNGHTFVAAFPFGLPASGTNTVFIIGTDRAVNTAIGDRSNIHTVFPACFRRFFICLHGRVICLLFRCSLPILYRNRSQMKTYPLPAGAGKHINHLLRSKQQIDN